MALPLCKLLEKEVLFHFNKACVSILEFLKKILISTLIIISTNWNESFKVMCDVSCMALGLVLGKKGNKLFLQICYESENLKRCNKIIQLLSKLLEVVYAFQKFQAYLLGTKVFKHIENPALQYLMSKKDLKPRRIRCVLLLEESEFQVKYQKVC